MQELVGGTIAGSDQWMNRTVGQMVELPPTLRLTAAPTLIDASQNPVPLQMQTVNGASVYRTEPIEKPGAYTLNTGTARLPIVVNVPSDEADIRTLDNAALKRSLGNINLETLGAEPLPESTLVKDEGRDFGWNVMLLVLAMVAMECFLAMRFGHHGKARGK
jgi:hypothetical protein